MSRLNSFLSGIRVLDLTRHLPGPLATLFLADLGCEVIKIEPPTGDEFRCMGPVDEQGDPLYFGSVNAGKSTCFMDLKDEGQKAAFLELVKTADVLFESFRPGKMAALGLGYDTLKEINPRLVFCSISGFGDDNSAYRDLAGHDANYLALSGVLAGLGASGRPSLVDPPMADCTAAMMSVITVVSALYRRTVDGQGCRLDLALADAAMPLMSLKLAELSAKGSVAGREEDLLNGGAAYYSVYETKDGRFLSVGPIEPKFWKVFCRAAGREDWIKRQSEPLPQIALKSEVAQYVKSLTLKECEEKFFMADCCVAPVLSLEEAVNSGHVKGRGLVKKVDGAYQGLFPAYVDGQPPNARRKVAKFNG